MNTPPDHPPEDERLPGEAELAALYRRLPRKEPGAALDAAVLRAARQVAGPRRRWPMALGSAAGLAVAALLGWHLRELPPAGERPAAYRAAPGAASVPATAPESAAPAQQPVPAAPAPALASPPAPAAASPPAAPSQDAIKIDQLSQQLSSGEPATSHPNHAPHASKARKSAPAAPAEAPSATAPGFAPAGGAATPRTEAFMLKRATVPAASAPAARMAEAIQRLLGQRRYDEARDQIRRYRLAYPDAPVPEAWRPYLPPEP